MLRIKWADGITNKEVLNRRAMFVQNHNYQSAEFIGHTHSNIKKFW